MKPNRRGVPAFLLGALVAVACSCSQVTAPTRAKSTPHSTTTPNTNDFSVNNVALKLPLAHPKIIVFKSRRRLMLYANSKLVRVYRIGLGTDPVNDKIKEGDRRTPEGDFYVF